MYKLLVISVTSTINWTYIFFYLFAIIFSIQINYWKTSSRWIVLPIVNIKLMKESSVLVIVYNWISLYHKIKLKPFKQKIRSSQINQNIHIFPQSPDWYINQLASVHQLIISTLNVYSDRFHVRQPRITLLPYNIAIVWLAKWRVIDSTPLRWTYINIYSIEERCKVLRM